MDELMCPPGPLPFFQSCYHLQLLQYPDYVVYCRSPYDHWYLPTKLTSISNNQGHLILIAAWNSGYLHPEHDILYSTPPPLQLTRMCPLCLLRSSMENTSRPCLLMKDGVTIFIQGPLLIKAMVMTPSIKTWLTFSGPNHQSCASSSQ